MKVNKVYKEKGVTFKDLKVGAFFTDYAKQDLWFKVNDTQASKISGGCHHSMEIEDCNHPLFEADVTINWWIL